MEKEASGQCSGIGCCSIAIKRELRGFRLTLVRSDDIKPQQDPVHLHVKAFLWRDYLFQTSDISSRWINISNLYDQPLLQGAVTDQPNCQSALRNYATYACDTNSHCDSAEDGYRCYCSGESHVDPILTFTMAAVVVIILILEEDVKDYVETQLSPSLLGLRKVAMLM